MKYVLAIVPRSHRGQSYFGMAMTYLDSPVTNRAKFQVVGAQAIPRHIVLKRTGPLGATIGHIRPTEFLYFMGFWCPRWDVLKILHVGCYWLSVLCIDRHPLVCHTNRRTVHALEFERQMCDWRVLYLLSALLSAYHSVVHLFYIASLHLSRLHRSEL